MAKHKYFEELCAMVPLGCLSPSQRAEMDGHLQECEECSSAVANYARLYEQIAPVKERLDGYIEARQNGMRNSVLASITALDHQTLVRELNQLPPQFRLSLPGLSLSYATAASLVAAASFWVGAHSVRRTPPPTLVKKTFAGASASNHLTEQTSIHVSDKSSFDAKSNELIAALDVERQHSAELARKISAQDSYLEQAVASQSTLQAQIETQAKALDETQGKLREVQSRLGQAQAKKYLDDTTLIALQDQVRTLSQKLDVQTMALAREQGLLTHGREIRDIVGARNLHIIDVYDTNADGDTTRPFARAFYAEHKSLVYYAYDLPRHRIADGKFSYVAWAQSNSNKKSVKRIGILFNDDQAQKRWTLNLTDPEALANINSVFITLESTDEDADIPKGKRMLTAYLGTEANHP